MKSYVFGLGALLVVFGVAAALWPPAALAPPLPQVTGISTPFLQLPRTFILDPAALASVRARIADSDISYGPALSKLGRDADGALRAGPFSVVNKTQTPPSGDKHDYFSQAPYYWPNPNTPDGLPYISKDGERNPEIENISDHRELGAMISAVRSLALAHYFRGEERYAQRAALLLRAWFLDDETRMNPSLTFAQYIPGQNTGRSWGIIDTADIVDVVDAIDLIEGSTSWTETDGRGMQDWFGEYLKWLRESKMGIQEARAENNHGTYYDAQVVAIALFLGKDDLARDTLLEARTTRIARQIEPDGRQPLELRRTRSWSYSTFNLRALFRLAAPGDGLGLDLWNYETEDGRSIRKALDCLVPFALRGQTDRNDQDWTYEQITPFEPGALFPLLRQAALKYNSDEYLRLSLAVAPKDPQSDRTNLTLPLPHQP